MTRLYSFGFALLDEFSVGVPSPELDAFVDAIANVCRGAGVGFRAMENCVTLVPLAKFDPLDLVRDLDEAECAGTFLEEVRHRWLVWKEARDAEFDAAAAADLRAQKLREEEALKRDGLTLSDGRYRLVKEGA